MIKTYKSPPTPKDESPATKSEIAALLETVRVSIEAKVVAEVAKVEPKP